MLLSDGLSDRCAFFPDGRVLGSVSHGRRSRAQVCHTSEALERSDDPRTPVITSFRPDKRPPSNDTLEPSAPATMFAPRLSVER